MSKLGPYAVAILQGGLPAALDLGARAGTKGGDSKPEQLAPSAGVKDRDTGTPPKPETILDHMTPTTWAIAAIGAVAVGVVLYFSIRAVK